MKYWKPVNAVDPDAAYFNGDRAEGIVGAKPPAQAIEHPMREIVAAVEGDGQVPTEGDLEQLAKAIPGVEALVAGLILVQLEVVKLRIQVAQLRDYRVGDLNPDAWPPAP